MRKLTIPAALALLLAACAGGGRDRRPAVTVSIEPYRYFADQVSGGRFRTAALVPRTSDPESYEPAAQQIIDLMDSRAYLASGYLGFETVSLRRIAEENPGLKVCNLADGIETIRGDGGGVDPHVWLSPRNAEVIAANICAAFCELDPADSAGYKARAAKLVRRIRSVDRRIRELTGGLEHRTFIIYHPALAYFAKDYGLRQLPVCAGGKEASPSHLRKLLTQSRAEGARTLFVQKQFPSDVAERIARDSGADIVEINPLAYRWDEEMLSIAESLAE